MKIKKGIFRIYIVLSILWSLFFLFGMLEYGSLEDLFFAPRYLNGQDFFLLFMFILPLPLFFILKWIAKGFE